MRKLENCARETVAAGYKQQIGRYVAAKLFGNPNCNTIPLLFHKVPNSTEAFIILRDEFFFSVLKSVLCMGMKLGLAN